tara:strand:+ start:3238 stop:3441 length:204 start_codon:yes stop_codon:yes gene_type:complete
MRERVPKKPLQEPHVSKELLDYMNQIFPDKCPDVLDTERKIWVNAGKRQAYEHFQKLHEKQQKNILK